MSRKVEKVHTVFSPGRRAASLTFRRYQLREAAEKRGWKKSRKDDKKPEVRWVVTRMISKGKKENMEISGTNGK